MTTPLRHALLEFIAALRAADVRISVAESLDAMRAVAAAGLMRAPMREALRAALIKDEADNHIFDEVFARRFGAGGAPPGTPHPSRGANIGLSGSGRGEGGGSPQPPPRDSTPHESAPHEEARPDHAAARSPESADNAAENPDSDSRRASAGPESIPSAAARDNDDDSDDSQPSRDSETAGDGAAEHDDRAEADAHLAGGTPDASPYAPGESFLPGLAVGRAANLREVERTPFALYSDLEYDQARDVLAVLKRRLRMRLSRRLRIAAAGRIDFRRTIRAGIQRGGIFMDLRYRARRKRHIDLLLLADISGSVKYASTLMLELAAGASQSFRRIRSFVYIDRLAEAGFERGHLVMETPIDLYARSDFGRVLAELWERRAELLSRATVVVIMGDARNNRRPARADLLRDIRRQCRTVLWLNPEPPERWDSGDSVIAQYGRVADALIPCGDLRMLERALARVA